MTFKWFMLIMLVFCLTGCTILGPAKIEISDASVLEAKVTGISSGDLNFRCICDSSTIQTTTPVFLSLRNSGGEADQLIKVETDRAVRVEFRRGNGPDDLTSAEPLQVVDIPALSKVDFKNG
ncbi:MAG: copper chaperone PCu(A)C, partial [Anaerolineaceae bacterium]|nr:copper chaperone PCu(A)C [Anaerolineaceae bacterium]